MSESPVLTYKIACSTMLVIPNIIKLSEVEELNFLPWDICLLIGDVNTGDINLLFGPEFFESQIFIRCPVDVEFPSLWKTFGFFESTSQARRCGWKKPIPDGFTEPFFIGKKHRKRLVTIFKVPDS